MSKPTPDATSGQPLPDPPIPADADLRHLPGMMIDVVRLRHSEFIMTASKAGIGAAFLLWSAAWHEVPAGSLPANERVLARLSFCDWDEWQALRDEALNDYTLCSDGRYYHKTCSEVAREALRYSRVASEKGRKGAAARWHGHSPGNGAGIARAVPGDSAGSAQAMPADANGREGNRTEENRSENARAGEVAINGTGPPGLVGVIHRAFISKGKHLMLSEHQMEFVRALADRAGHEADPDDWTRRYLNTAWKLRQAGKDVWRGQPWQPSAVCGEKMQVRVVEAMEAPDAEVPEAVKRVAERMAQGGKW